MKINFDKFLKRKLFLLSAASVAFVSFAGSADAGLSTIYRSYANEPDLLPNLPTGADGNSAKTAFSTPVITTLESNLGFTSFTRIDDAQDQYWAPVGNTQTAQLLGVFTSDSEAFGILNGTTGSTFTPVTSTNANSTLSYVNQAAIQFHPSSVFRLGLDNYSLSTLLSSVNSQNGDGQDHFVSFLINNGAYAGDYIIGVEDTSTGQSGADFDYNDNIILLSGVTVAAPEPSTYLILGSTLLVGAFLSRKRERQVAA